ncbi:hypothetical protein KUCAC02_035812 [Chaenocephalus aceratus]|nr:hypothetical protein KUCAC02_035812 [Chaenocephalus aceratus]
MSTKMEQPFYHDDSYLSAALSQPEVPPEAEIDPYQGRGHHHHDGGSLKLASPELERLIIQNGNGVITTPTPGQYFYNRASRMSRRASRMDL